MGEAALDGMKSLQHLGINHPVSALTTYTVPLSPLCFRVTLCSQHAEHKPQNGKWQANHCEVVHKITICATW